MNDNLKLFIVIIILLNLILIIRTLKLKRISIRYGVLWITLLILLLFVGLFPNLFIYVSDFFGFESASNMVFLLGFFFLFYLNFLLITNISLLNDKIKILIQENSILKERVDRNERKK